MLECMEILFFSGTLNRHAPIRHKRTRRNSVPWITPRIKGLVKNRDYHKKRAIKYASRTHWESFKKLRNEVNIQMRNAKSKFFHVICQKRGRVLHHGFQTPRNSCRREDLRKTGKQLALANNEVITSLRVFNYSDYLVQFTSALNCNFYSYVGSLNQSFKTCTSCNNFKCSKLSLV